MPLTLRSKVDSAIPVSLAGLTPDAVAKRSIAEIQHALVWQGNLQRPLGELFDVSGDPTDLMWRMEGDCSRVDHLAAGMTAGEVHVDGDVGHHAGHAMRGGSLHVSGSAGDWLGAEMLGGAIEVAGDAGHHAGGAVVGMKVGMRGGQIVVRGDVGDYAAEGMRRGWMAVLGDCGVWAGYRMRAGTLMVLGTCGPRPGAEMRRGTIVLLGKPPELPPTFRYACDYQPVALSLMIGPLQSHAAVPAIQPPQQVALYNGDLLEGGRGEVLIGSAAR